jgi:hypothetical protein
MNLQFELERDTIVSYESYPDSILTGLAKIGGLIAIFRIGYLLTLCNKYWFERQMASRVLKGGEDTDQIAISSSPLDKHNNLEGGIQTVTLPLADSLMDESHMLAK